MPWENRRLSALALAISSFVLYLGCANSSALRCDVHVAPEQDSELEVTCRLGGRALGDLRLQQMVQDEILRLSDFSATTTDGAPLPVEPVGVRPMGSAARRFTEHLIRAGDATEVVYAYRVRPGAPAGDEMRGSYGRRFGHVDSRGGVVSGRSLFLLPAWYEALSEIDVRFRLPFGWQAVGSLPIRSGAVELRAGKRTAATLIESVIGFGRFTEERAETAAGAIRVLIRDDLHPEKRRELFKVARDGFDFLGRQLGPLDHEYTVVWIPPSEDGSMILVPPSGSGQGGEISGAGPAQAYDMIYAMAKGWMLGEEARLELQNQDAWMMDALPDFLAIRALEAVGIRAEAESWLLRARQARQSSVPLQRPLPPGPAGLPERRVKGSILLAILDDRLRGMEPGAVGLDAVVARLRNGSLGRGFFDSLADVSPQDWRPMQELASAAGPISEESLSRLTRIEPLELAVPPSAKSGAAGPQVRLLVTANTRGMLEVCGCVAHQTGGIARRESIRRRLLRGREPVVLVDLGNAYPMDRREPLLGPVELREMDLVLDLMGRQQYGAAAIGHTEMMRGPRFFREAADRRPLPYVNSNLGMGGERLALPWVITPTAGLNIAWISALDTGSYGEEHQRFYELRVEGLRVDEPVEALARAAREVRGRADLVIAIGSLSPKLVRTLLDRVPEIDAMLSSESPAAALDGVLRFATGSENTLIGLHRGRVVLFSTGEGRWLEKLTLSVGHDGRFAGADLRQTVLGEGVPDAPAFRRRLAAFYDSMREHPDLAGAADPVARILPALLGSNYIGAVACRPCHEAEWADWEETAHGRAFSTLVRRHRNFAPRCIACHVTGYGYPSGYRFGDPSERLRHVQCEMCHGPGSAHSRAPAKVNIHRRPQRSICFECHTPHHSELNEDNFEEYYGRVSHRTRTAPLERPVEAAAVESSPTR